MALLFDAARLFGPADGLEFLLPHTAKFTRWHF